MPNDGSASLQKAVEMLFDALASERTQRDRADHAVRRAAEADEKIEKLQKDIEKLMWVWVAVFRKLYPDTEDQKRIFNIEK